MVRRARSTVVQTSGSESVSTITVETPSGLNLAPITQRLLPTFHKIDKSEYFSEEEFDRICLMTAGDVRRAIQRLILGIYQRALTKHDDAQVKRARLMISLHESNKLEENLESL